MAYEPAAQHQLAPGESHTYTVISRAATRLVPLRSSEWLLCAFFLQVVVVGLWRHRGFLDTTMLALIIPLSLVAAARADAASRGRVWSIVRDWVPAALMLVAYWSVDWNAKPPGDRRLEHALIGWDRALLNDWGLRTAIERFGALVPTTLELAYLLVYAILPVIIASFYIRHQRHRLEGFLFPFLLGSLIVYALLPHFPSEAPRFVFAGEDLPRVDTVLRRFNVWILEHGDIRSSVFPSGHVAVGFSTAFAMWLAIPAHRGVGWMLLALAVLVWINTVYGRYHYAADGLVGLMVSAASIGVFAMRRAPATRSPA